MNIKIVLLFFIVVLLLPSIIQFSNFGFVEERPWHAAAVPYSESLFESAGIAGGTLNDVFGNTVISNFESLFESAAIAGPLSEVFGNTAISNFESLSAAAPIADISLTDNTGIGHIESLFESAAIAGPLSEVFGNTVMQSSGTGGSGGGSNAKPELSSLEFSSIESGILKGLTSFEVGEHIDVEISFNDGTGLGMQHVELITSHFSIEYDKYKPLVVNDQNQFLMEEPQVTAINEGTQTDVSFGLKFAKTLPESDITIKAWNTNRNSFEQTFENAWKVIESTIPEPDKIMDPESTVGTEPSFSWEIFDQWAGYSSTEVTDSNFLSYLGYDGEKIPYWFKKNNAKWLKDELISQEDILNAIEFLVKKGYAN